MAMTRKRKLLLVMMSLVLLIIALFVALPLWFPWTLQPVLKKRGVEFSSYQRRGYSRLLLMDVKYTNANVKISAKRVQLLQPPTWIWRHFTGQKAPADYAKIVGWRVEILEPRFEKKQKSTKATNVTPAFVLKQINSALPKLISWLPLARFENGDIRFKKEQLSVPRIIWDRGLLTANVSSIKFAQSAAINLFTTSEPLQLSVKLDPMGVNADFEISSDTTLAKIDSIVSWQTNQLHIAAQFQDNWIPETASADASNFRLPASLVKLEGYDDLNGSLSGVWKDKHFVVDLDANAQPRNAAALPPVVAAIHLNGDTRTLHIEQANVATPWLKANLSHDVEMDFTGKLLSPEAALTLDADLSKQDFLRASGRLTGEAFLRRTEQKYPQADFQLDGNSLQGFGIQLENLHLVGTLNWPWLQISPANIRLAPGGTVNTTARLNFVTRQIENGSLEIKDQVGRALLKNVSYTNLSLMAEFSGPFTEPQHALKATIGGLSLPKTTPLNIKVSSRGKLLDIEKLQASVSAKNSELKLEGWGKIQTNELALRLSEFSLRKGNELRLGLQNEATVFLQKKKNGLGAEFENFDIRGKGGELALQGNVNWPATGKATLAITNLNAAEFQDFFKEPLANLKIDLFHFDGSWTNGPVDFVLRTRGEFSPTPTNRFSFSATGSGNNEGISFEEMKVLSASEPVVTARGFLPARINPMSTNPFELRPKQLIDFRADTTINKVFWNQIASWTKIKLTDPEIHVLVSGSLEKPHGKIILRAEEANFLGKRENPLPTVQKLQADVDLNEKNIRLNRFNVLIEGQPLLVTAELPAPDDLSQHWSKVFDWRKATGKIVITNAEFTPFVKFAPEILSPQGRLDMNVAFTPGPKFDGWISVSDAATRPLPGTGPLHELQMRLRLVDQRIEFQDVHGLLGGQPVALSGKVDFEKMKARLPLVDLKLTGQDVPLARQPEAIIRGNLNLIFSNLTNDLPVVAGEVQLRDSFYLGDIKQLAPGKVASVEQRPPFFSIDKKPLADWKINVHVAGENFLKVRSPLFKGSISANMKIIGTLKEPLALGDVKIDSGTIQFPFANFNVTQGLITLTSDDPYHPDLFVTAASRAFSYDLKMSAEGPADKPVIEFNSTPSLTSEQIILMVTAGEVPRSDFGFSTQQRAQKLAMFVGKSILSKFSEPAGAERLTIKSGEEVSEKGRETYSLEYKLGDRWSVVGEYDRFGALNVGMKWRVYSK